MKRLKEHPNGMPLHIGDFSFLQNAIMEAIAGQLMDKNCVLKGCELTKINNNSDFKISEGWVYIDGEIYYVPTHTVIDNDGNNTYDASNFTLDHADLGSSAFLDNFGFIEQITYDANGNDTFEDGSNRNTYEIRRMEGRHYVQGGEPTPGDANYLSIAGRTKEEVFLDNQWAFMDLPVRDRTVNGYIKGSLQEYSYRYCSYKNTSLPGYILHYRNTEGGKINVNQNSWMAAVDIYIYQDISDDLGHEGTVHLSGRVDSTNVSSDVDTSFHDGSNVEPYQKPSGQKRIPITADASTANSPPRTALLIINTNGSMEIWADNLGSTSHTYLLDGVSYKP